MALPYVFLLGLLVVVGHREFGDTLPGAATTGGLLLFGCLLCAPVVLALLARASARRELLTGRRSLSPPPALLRLSACATPAVLLAFFEFGAYGDLVETMAPESLTLRVVLTLLPLYAVELPRMPVATLTSALLDVNAARGTYLVRHASLLPSWRDAWPLVRLQLGWPVLVLLPAGLFGLGLDVLQVSRTAYVAVLGTSFGSAAGLLVMVLLLALLLPFWFRIAFGARPLSTPLAPQLYEIARRLGFTPQRVLELPTGMRAVNAMMVGPLPFGRYLCLTDALLEMLDEHAIAGVMAHEIGHARRGHPGLLGVVALALGLLLLTPLRFVDGEALDPSLQAGIALLMTGCVWLAVRTIAHRFEHEADVESVRQLGAGPCSAALEIVMRDTGARPRRGLGRLFTLHPDELERRQLMHRYEQDPTFRSRFDKRGRRLRHAIAVLTLSALGSGAWAWSSEWPLERVVVHYYTGDLAGAHAALGQLGDVPSHWAKGITHLREEIEAGHMLLGNEPTGDFLQLRSRLEVPAWQRGESVLLERGPAAARRWFALALMTVPAPSRLHLAIEAYCAAADDNNPERVAALVAIVRRLGVPPELAPVFAE